MIHSSSDKKPAKLSLRTEKEIKPFTDKQKMRKFITIKPAFTGNG
jgi:hypothetical protein